MKISLVVFFLFSFFFRANAQINSQFINHLVLSNQHKEHKTYLNYLLENNGYSDSLTYYRMKYYLLLKDYNSFESEIQNCKLCFKDSSLLNYSASYLFKSSIASAERLWKIDSKFGSDLTKTSLLRKSFDLTKNTQGFSDFLPYELKVHYNEYKFVKKKKAWIAAGLSMVIPGSGKLYIGRPNSFFGSFISNVLYGLTGFESVRVLGINNGYSIVSLSAFGIFYFSNVIGVVHDLKRIKNEKKKHFLYEVATYQSADIYLYK